MKAKYRHAGYTAAVLVAITLSGCGGVTMSPIKRAPVQIDGYQSHLQPVQRNLLIKFEEVIPGHQVSETVWDNVSGPFFDIAESNQIGFTQDYGKLMAGTAVGGIPGGMVAGMRPDYTRIVIPFGRIFEEEFKSGLAKAFPNAYACTTKECETASHSPQYVVEIKISQFKIWEKPMNHLNLKATIDCKIRSVTTPEYVFQINKQLDGYPLASGLATSQSVIREMNKASNQFSAELAEDILKELQK
jgi:hypothetical protein